MLLVAAYDLLAALMLLDLPKVIDNLLSMEWDRFHAMAFVSGREGDKKMNGWLETVWG